MLFVLEALSWYFLDDPANWRDEPNQAGWPIVPGKVTSSEIFSRGSGLDNTGTKTYWCLKVRFDYEVDGVRYSGDQKWMFGRGPKQPQSAPRDRGYYEGATVPVHYDLGEPGNSVTSLGRSGSICAPETEVAAITSSIVVFVLGPAAAITGGLLFIFGFFYAVWILMGFVRAIRH